LPGAPTSGATSLGCFSVGASIDTSAIRLGLEVSGFALRILIFLIPFNKCVNIKGESHENNTNNVLTLVATAEGLQLRIPQHNAPVYGQPAFALPMTLAPVQEATGQKQQQQNRRQSFEMKQKGNPDQTKNNQKLDTFRDRNSHRFDQR
jgi:hypothetical protein